MLFSEIKNKNGTSIMFSLVSLSPADAPLKQCSNGVNLLNTAAAESANIRCVRVAYRTEQPEVVVVVVV